MKFHVSRLTWRLRFVVAILAVAMSVSCKQKVAPAQPPEPPTLAVTSWTGTSELFMEHPPFVAGQTIRFAVHLTRLNDFAAVKAGKPRIEFTPEAGGGAPVVLPGTDALRPGAFRVEGKLPPAGKYRWALLIEGTDVSDRHDLGTATVFASEADAVADAEKRGDADAAAIAYLKEQQWTNPFATAQVHEADVRTSIRVPAAIEPVTGGEAIVAAPADGRYSASDLPSVGDRVAAGQTLGRLEPRLADGGDDRATLAATVAEAQATLEAARADQARAERLLSDRAVPARRVEDARRATMIAEARLTAAQARLAQRDQVLGSGGGAAAGNAFALRAPIAGRIADVFAALGASYDEGAPLFRVVRTDEVELQAQVPVADVPAARTVRALAFEVPGVTEPIDLKPGHVHDAGVIDEKTRALPLQIEVRNPGGRLLIGQAGTAVLYTGATQRVPVVPRDAVLMEAGRAYVFVQVSGEKFDRRFIDVISRDGGIVGVRNGLKLGDRVVTRGAYEIQLASAAKGLPAEGHVH